MKTDAWELEEIHEKLGKKMRQATDAVFDKQAEPAKSPDAPARVDLRTAAYVLAVQRVAQTATERGVWP